MGGFIQYGINSVLNLFLFPIGLSIICFTYPALVFINFLKRCYNYYTWTANNKVVLVTGASSGIGEHVAYEFARRGAHVMLVAQRHDKLEAVAATCRSFAQKEMHIHHCDVSKEEQCHKAVERCVEIFGRLDVLVLNAGIAHAYLFDEVNDIKAMTHQLDVNFYGYVNMTLPALPHLKKSGGRMLVNASIASFAPFPRFTLYNASKSAIVQFYDTLRSEIASRGVAMTIVMPGAVASELTAGKVMNENADFVLDQQKRDALLGPQPMLGTATCARNMVDALQSMQRYLITPFWCIVLLLLRIFAYEFLTFNLWSQMLPPMEGVEAPAKLAMEYTGASKLLYHPPTQNMNQAKLALNANTKKGK